MKILPYQKLNDKDYKKETNSWKINSLMKANLSVLISILNVNRLKKMTDRREWQILVQKWSMDEKNNGTDQQTKELLLW